MTIFAIILGAIYLLVGTVKAAGVKRMADQFDEFGLGNTGLRAVGALEIAAAVGLQIDGVRTFASLGMVLAMAGALFFHNKVGHAKDQSVPALIVLIASASFFVLSI